MDLEQIKQEWMLGAENEAAQIVAWDSTAEEYVYEPKNNFDEDPFLRFIADQIDLTPNLSSLDVGCGAGAYSVAMAQRIGMAHGVDLSPRMIELGQQYAKQNGIHNVQLWVRNWHTCDVGEFYKKYDIVFAHTTPAIADLQTLQKMIAASTRHCFYCTTARRTDLVFDECKKIAGVTERDHDKHILYTFNALWLMGYDPIVSYANTTWLPVKSYDEAKSWFTGRLRAHYELNTQAEKNVSDYLQSLVQPDGMIHEQIQTTLVNMYWDVSE
ncbi:MAG: methyltransferase domain-containing protein [Coriobacteriales bacterium]|nr:methyltransferase domain-containing protein [Coriobacteriales bacterium]